MESDSLYARAGTRAAFGPDSRPPDLKQHDIGARNTSGTGRRNAGGPRFTWEVSVEIPDKTPSCSVGDGPSPSQQSPASHQASARTASLSGSIMPVDDPVVVKSLTSQVGDWSKAFLPYLPLAPDRGDYGYSTPFLVTRAPVRLAYVPFFIFRISQHS